MLEKTPDNPRATNLKQPGYEDVGSTHETTRANWPLRIGSVILFFVLMLAIVGPSIAPRDPLEVNQILKVGDEWITIPFPAFTPGFPLGSDRQGRDLLSRLLWGIHPTLILITVIAVVRLVLGLAVGLLAGWSGGRVGRALNTLITGALTVPVLMVALGTIAIVGVDLGLLAFIIGLSVNGWAETAQLVRDQTRIVRSQPYSEAARVLGESDLQIIVRHVRRQVMPMVWMLFAFEISGTLLVTAGLAFLGYYIGGDVWVEIDELQVAAARVSGMPELGQMLATAWVSLNQPWAVFAVGGVIFVTMLSFNLIGIGMRQRLELMPIQRPTLYAKTIGHIGQILEERILLPFNERDRRIAYLATAIGVLIVFAGGGLLWWKAQAATSHEAPLPEMAIPGGHPWATERHDPWGTLWTPVSGPVAPTIQWHFKDPAGFSGGPAISAGGTLHIASQAGILYTLDDKGILLWQATLPMAAVGTPALDADGNIYAVDKGGTLSAFTQAGDLRWQYRPEAGSFGTSGPIVAPDGRIYYTLGQDVQAVSPNGEPLWKVRVLSTPRHRPPRLSPTSELLFLAAAIVEAKNGSLPNIKSPAQVNQYIVGADARTYLISENVVSEWSLVDSEIEVNQSATWDYRKFTILLTPSDAGATHDQTVWLLYTSARPDTRVVWLDMSGRLIGNVRYPLSEARIIAIGRDSIAYTCGGQGRGLECVALAPRSEKPIWSVPLEGRDIQGGALIPDRLYITTEEGNLYAIGDGQP